jgi:hypothetical protein
MSELMYVKKPETRKKAILADKPLTTNHMTLILTIVSVVGTSILRVRIYGIHLRSLFRGICVM